MILFSIFLLKNLIHIQRLYFLLNFYWFFRWFLFILFDSILILLSACTNWFRIREWFKINNLFVGFYINLRFLVFFICRNRLITYFCVRWFNLIFIFINIIITVTHTTITTCMVGGFFHNLWVFLSWWVIYIKINNLCHLMRYNLISRRVSSILFIRRCWYRRLTIFLKIFRIEWFLNYYWTLVFKWRFVIIFFQMNISSFIIWVS